AMLNSIKELDKSVQSIKSDLLTINDKFRAISARVTNVCARVQRLESKLVAMSKVDNNEQVEINQLKANNKLLQAQNKALAIRIARLEKRHK
ncbi:hypothetical protein KBA27_03155, partial [bacterium]|nr:hypothetical protein [bacterium]